MGLKHGSVSPQKYQPPGYSTGSSKGSISPRQFQAPGYTSQSISPRQYRPPGYSTAPAPVSPREYQQAVLAATGTGEPDPLNLVLPGLLIGSMHVALSLEKLKAHGITHVVNAAGIKLCEGFPEVCVCVCVYICV
jgi:hypothetical protein